MELKAILMLILLATPIFAVEEDLSVIQPMVLPDNPFYVIKIKLYEPATLLISIDKEIRKIELAQVRIAEMREMAKKNKSETVAKLQIEHDKLIEEAAFANGTDVESTIHMEKIKDALEMHSRSIVRLQTLLTNENMPEASKKGLRQALESASKHLEIKRENINKKIKDNKRGMSEEMRIQIEENTMKRIAVESAQQVKKLDVKKPNLAECASPSIVLESVWRNPTTGEIITAKSTCEAKKYKDAGWELTKR